MQGIIRNPLILFFSLVASFYSIELSWAIGLNGELENPIYYDGTAVLHQDLSWLPRLFYAGAFLVVGFLHITKREETYKLSIYKGIFFLNLFFIGAFLFVMIIDYHMSSYFIGIELGYIVWLIANVILMSWLYVFCYTKVGLPYNRTNPNVLDDLPDSLTNN
ncbi:MAG: hypothetical protein ACRBFS_08585 [Aureispira sp.]